MLEVYFDGAAAGNPGCCAIGVFIKGEGHLIEIGEAVGEGDNHIAEFRALARAAEEARQIGGIVSLRTDSKVVFEAVEKRYAKNPFYKPLLKAALAALDDCELYFIKWIPDTENRAADQLARRALQSAKR